MTVRREKTSSRTPAVSARVRRRDVLAGLAGLAGLALSGSPGARAQTRRINEVRALRLTRGLMAAGWLQNPPGDASALRRQLDNRYQPEDFAAIRTLGFNHIRVPIQPELLAPGLADGRPALDKDRLALFDEAMGHITRSGLAMVLVNSMTAAAKDKCAADTTYRDAMAEWWHDLAGHVAGHDRYHLDGTFFELFNEPEGSFDDTDLYRATIERFLAAVRASAPQHTIIVGGNNWNSVDGVTKGLKTPLPDENLIYSFHFYHPLEFTHQGVEAAGPLYAKLRDVPWDVDAGALADDAIGRQDPSIQPVLRDYNQKSHRRADLQGPFADMRRWCDTNGQIAWLGEFGVHNAAAQAQHRIAWTHHVRELAEEHKFGWNMAEARGAFGLFLPGEARPLRPDRPLLGALGL